MAAIITNIVSMHRVGILADRSPRAASIGFKRYNLIYGYNGAGKSTLSRVFASFQNGHVQAKLPSDCMFKIALDDGTELSSPEKMAGLEARLVVFNADYIEENLQWSVGKAKPVFYIGADQAQAAEQLTEVEAAVAKMRKVLKDCDDAKSVAERSLARFKREGARTTSGRLHLSGRKYEAPAFTKDLEQWREGETSLLSEEALGIAEEVRRLAEPLPLLSRPDFDISSVEVAYKFILEICSQSMAKVALEEIDRYPDMLLWLKQGHTFHVENSLEDCLYCRNKISAERRADLTSAFDTKVDEFVARLDRTFVRLDEMIGTITRLSHELPSPDSVATELRLAYRDDRKTTVALLTGVTGYLEILRDILASKRARPATPSDVSGAIAFDTFKATISDLFTVIERVNSVIDSHNASVNDFAKNKSDAEIAIRKHYVAENKEEFISLSDAFAGAEKALLKSGQDLQELVDRAVGLRLQVRKHGPAADVINKLVASYLGHGELTIHPVEDGYHVFRHGELIKGAPSEGEKTAIALSYFLCSLSADGKKLKDLIVVVDDPVSSLDTKALNFACALVRSRLSDAAQLFILTHNLQCMNEFRKAWKNKVRPQEGKDPTASMLFLDVTVPEELGRRQTSIVEMSRLLRDYDSEYHYLFSHILKFSEKADTYYDHGYMMPNVLRRALDVFLAFRCPGPSGLASQIERLCADFPELDKNRLTALERLSQVESHSDNLDDLLLFSSMTLEETRDAATAFLSMMEVVDGKHLAALKRLCR